MFGINRKRSKDSELQVGAPASGVLQTPISCSPEPVLENDVARLFVSRRRRRHDKDIGRCTITGGNHNYLCASQVDVRPFFIGLEGRNSKADDGYRMATVVYLIGGQAYPCSVIQEVLFLNVCTRRDSTVVIGERGLRLIACIGVKT